MCHGLFQSLSSNGHEIPKGILFAPMIDARRMEVYTALFDNRMNVLKETHALVVDDSSFNELLKDHPIYFFGSGAEKLSSIIVHPNAMFIPGFFVSSSHMSALAYNFFLNGKFEEIAYFEPFYLKAFITTNPKKKI
jgi:tRNA threonylcarbamoyladenosine biosynthesis protein TsaB